MSSVDMNFNRKLCYFCTLCLCLLLLMPSKTESGILPLTLIQKFMPEINADTEQQQASTIAATIAHRFAGYIEYQPNGTIILRSSSLENTTNLQNLMLFKTILKAIKLSAPFEGAQTVPATKLNIKIYGDGIEHKFPPFLERIIQRIQTYFSVYRYTDTSRPVRLESSTNTYAASTQPEEGSFVTTTVIDIEDNNGHTGDNYLNYVDDFENTTAFIDPDTATDVAGNEDYPEFIEVKANVDFANIGQD